MCVFKIEDDWPNDEVEDAYTEEGSKYSPVKPVEEQESWLSLTY